jgi:hypothetical protein
MLTDVIEVQRPGQRLELERERIAEPKRQMDRFTCRSREERVRRQEAAHAVTICLCSRSMAERLSASASLAVRASWPTGTSAGSWMGSVPTDEHGFTMTPFGSYNLFAKWIDEGTIALLSERVGSRGARSTHESRVGAGCRYP